VGGAGGGAFFSVHAPSDATAVTSTHNESRLIVFMGLRVELSLRSIVVIRPRCDNKPLPALVAQATGMGIFLFSAAGFFGLPLLINILRGRTCRCFLRTAVQTEQLPPLSRVRRAQKVFARIRPLIAAAQGGELSPEMISARMREPVPSSARAPTAGADNPGGVPPRLDS